MPDEFARALSHAYRLLSYRARSERELSSRLLKKGFGEAVVSAVMERLRGGGYVDDGAFARSLRRRAEEIKLLGSHGARQYLLRMGIPPEAVEEALADYDEAGPAALLLRRKRDAMKGLSPETAQRRLAGYLKRRGYSHETVMRTVKSRIGRNE